MAAKTPKKDRTDEVLDEALEGAAAPHVAYRVEATVFQAALNTLAELPYNKVGNLLNQLRAATPITEVDDSE